MKKQINQITNLINLYMSINLQNDF